MVAHFTVLTCGVNQEIRLAEGIWLRRKSGQIRFFFGKYFFLHHACASCSEQPSNIEPWLCSRRGYYVERRGCWPGGVSSATARQCCTKILSIYHSIVQPTLRSIIFIYHAITCHSVPIRHNSLASHAGQVHLHSLGSMLLGCVGNSTRIALLI